MNKLFLGWQNENKFNISLSTLQRHLACFGSSGSGKTVACKVLIEEIARKGIPVIAFDPQGDIASLVESEEENEIKEKGILLSIAKEYQKNTEVLIWTPGSSKGLPLSINPLQFQGITELEAEDQVRFLSSAAKNLTALIGYDLASDEGMATESILNVVFEYCIRMHITLSGFNNLIELLNDLPESVQDQIKSVSSEKIMKVLVKKLSFLTMGSRRLIFETGIPANIDVLLGLDDKADQSKTRISVIYLNTLQTQEEKDFFIANITQMLYNWMLKHPLKTGQDGIQCAYYLDEVAPYIPPVRKTACKAGLSLLFKQARKYGVSCLIATQNPGDLDYKAIAQFATYNLGRLSTKQDIQKVKNRLDSMMPEEADNIAELLPSLNKGSFLYLSPDEFSTVQELNVRWLVTKHTVLSEDQLSDYISDDIRELYSKRESEEEIEINGNKSESLNVIKIAKVKEDEVLCVRNNIYETDLVKIIKPLLKGLVFKSEELSEVKFSYLPLLKVDLVFFKEKGLFKKTTEEINENLYLHYKTHDILSFKKKVITFSSLIDMDPNKIDDLDENCEFEVKSKSEVDFDFRKLGKKIDKKEIKNLLERKYRVEVSEVELLLLPAWICNIMDKKTGEERILNIDGIFGNIFERE